MVTGEWCLVTQFTINVCHGLRLRIKFVMKESAGQTRRGEEPGSAKADSE